MVVLTKERPILPVLKQMILDEIKQSNGIKPPNNNFFMIFLKFLPHKGPFCWKVTLKNIYTFYLKHQKYPFCAPIFRPLSETESCGNIFSLPLVRLIKTHLLFCAISTMCHCAIAMYYGIGKGKMDNYYFFFFLISLVKYF